MRERVAIIGGGVAGLSAAYLLNQKHQITLFEKDDRVGGNAHTLATRDGLNFDIAVAVFGKKSYPNFVRLLKELKIESCRLSGNGLSWRNLDTKEEAHFPLTWRGCVSLEMATSKRDPCARHARALRLRKCRLLSPRNAAKIVVVGRSV